MTDKILVEGFDTNGAFPLTSDYFYIADSLGSIADYFEKLAERECDGRDAADERVVIWLKAAQILRLTHLKE
jgi:hypothetical protein